MGSSGGDSGGSGQMPPGVPMPGLPIAGQGADIDPYNYGEFQNFLPDIKAEGQNPNATGLRPDMFAYKSPDGTPAADARAKRDELAKLAMAAAGGGPAKQPGLNEPNFVRADPQGNVQGF